ncbi:MAG: hypothetical protein P1P88_19115, partial [Bacteroidales bacterium]|nr:hypothetical protein [Bacteroidales bacterium]
YKLYAANMFNQNIIFVEIKHDYTTSVLKKHLEQLSEKLKTKTVAVISHIEAYKRQRLIEKKISFIIPGKQMYMPHMLIDLKEFKLSRNEKPKSMTPATQLLLLYHLQIESIEGINLKNIAERIKYDSATITRSAHYLQTMELCEFDHNSAKEKFLNFKFNKEKLWEKVKPLMSTPIKKLHYFNGKINSKMLHLTNNNALAHYTDLNDNDIAYYAIKIGNLKLLENPNIRKTAVNEGNICVEEWKYNPSVLSNGQFVDPLSLYLCFKDVVDERVEMALEQLIKKVKW